MQSDSPQTSPSEERLDPIATDIQAIETELSALKARYHQVRADEELRTTLKAQQTTLSEINPKTAETQADLQTLTTQLDEIEMRLESRLLSWLGIRQYFWQVLRFGGLGLLMGWALAYLAIGDRDLKRSNPSTAPIDQRR